jgi:hypothetical protein
VEYVETVGLADHHFGRRERERQVAGHLRPLPLIEPMPLGDLDRYLPKAHSLVCHRIGPMQPLVSGIGLKRAQAIPLERGMARSTVYRLFKEACNTARARCNAAE